MRWFVICLLLFSFPAVAALDCHWPFKTQVTVNTSANVPDNYQVRINITASDLFSGYDWSSDGRDLRVFDSDDNTALDFWIDRWDQSTETASIWVRFSSLSPGSRTLYLYYGNQNAQPITQVPPVFTYPGIRFHTRNTSANPTNYTQAVNAFESAADGVTGYGCKFITDFTAITNRNQFSPSQRRDNFGARSESYFEVKPGEAGFWEFRYGSDFGRGGGLFVNSTALEEQWNDDLWWANNWSNSDVLEGGINLTAGYHKLEVLGFEGCCDGGITVQFRKPGGSWQTFTTSNIDIRSAACPVQTNIAFGAHTVCRAELEVMSFGSGSNNSTAPDVWVEASPRAVTYKVRNNGDKPTLPDTRLDITLPGNLNLDSSTLNGWSCPGSTGNTLNCVYSTAVSSGAFFPDITLNLIPTSTLPSPVTLSATVTGLQYDADLNNNTRAISLAIRALNLPSGLTGGCSAQPGLVTGFFNTQGNPDGNGWADNKAEFDTLENSYAKGPTLYGYTLLNQVNGSANPFGSDEQYLTVFDGYIRLDADGDYRFAVDGDDAVELTLVDSNNVEHIAAWYGGHGAINNPQTNSPATIINNGFGQGFFRFRFRHQENAGGDSFRAYWRRPGDSSYSLIPTSQFFNCTADQNIELSSVLAVISDPINSSNFKAIPGAVINYTVVAKNLGNISSDLNTTVLEQAIDDGSELQTGSLSFTDGAGNKASGLNIAGVTVTYLNAAGNPVTPATGFDPLVRKIRMSFSGTFKPKFDTLEPEFSYQYRVRLQ